jgi:hypothetical protein
LLGWGISAAGMRAALSARDKVLLKSSLQVAQETYVYYTCHFYSIHTILYSAAGAANPDEVFKIEIFQGDFLDIRSVINTMV